MRNLRIFFPLVLSLLAAILLLLCSCAPEPGLKSTAKIPTKNPDIPTENSVNNLPPTNTMADKNQEEETFLILEIPILEYPGGNQLVEPNITGYDQEIVMQGEEFVLDPETLGFTYGRSVGAKKLQVIEIRSESMIVDELADVQFDGNFHPRDPAERIEIVDGTCIDAFPLVMDVFYRYCFELDTSGTEPILRYGIAEESMLPTP